MPEPVQGDRAERTLRAEVKRQKWTLTQEAKREKERVKKQEDTGQELMSDWLQVVVVK